MKIMDINTAKSFASEANMARTLHRLGLEAFRYLVVHNAQGRVTPVFPVSSLGSFPTFPASCGFMVLG